MLFLVYDHQGRGSGLPPTWVQGKLLGFAGYMDHNLLNKKVQVYHQKLGTTPNGLNNKKIIKGLCPWSLEKKSEKIDNPVPPL